MRTANTPVPNRDALANVAPAKRRGERGAVLVHAAFAMIGLISFSALVVDYGILWSARRQAQNAADAGAMAAAVSLAYVDLDNHDLARTSAISTAHANSVWGAEPDITDADVTFPGCPPGLPIASANACVRVDVFRNQRPGGSPLPTIFGRLAGISEQGVQATATARVLFNDSSDCVKPWAMPDRWGPRGVWDPTDVFDPLVNFYQWPGSSNDAGTGFTRESTGLNSSDYGLHLTPLKHGNADTAIVAGSFYPVVVDPGSSSSDRYGDAIETCSSGVLGPGTTLTAEVGNIGDLSSTTQREVQDLIARDPDALWDPSANGGKGGIVGGCQAAGTCEKSPRLVAVPAFDAQAYYAAKDSGQVDPPLEITKILGFFVSSMQGTDLDGYLSFYPGPPRVNPSGHNVQAASFVVSVTLVR